jgi:amino acid transporter
VFGLFANFSVAFTYLSPMVGIYSLFLLGVGTGGPGYLWLTLIPVAGMLLVALVFGELASHYPVAGALYQYSKSSVGAGYGWFVGWFYGIARSSRSPRWTTAWSHTSPRSHTTGSTGTSTRPATARSSSSR